MRAVDVNLNIGPFSPVFTFTVATGDFSPPSPPLLLNPPAGSLLPPGAIALDWSDSIDDVGVTSYTVDVFQISATGAATLVFTASPAASNALTGPLPEGVYQWRARAFDAAGNASAFSDPTGAFTLSATAVPDVTAPTTAPAQISPADASTSADVTPTFNWSAAADPDGTIAFHRVEVFSPGPTLVWSADTPDLTATAQPLPTGVYTWRITAFNVSGLTAVSAGPDWTFTVDTTLDVSAPSIVIQVTPIDGETVVPGPIGFTWRAATDDFGVAYYLFQLDDEGQFQTPQMMAVGTSQTSVTATLDIGTYFWRVRAVDQNGNLGPWSAVRVLLVQPTPAPPPPGGGPAPVAEIDVGGSGGKDSNCLFFTLSAAGGGAAWPAALLLIALLARRRRRI